MKPKHTARSATELLKSLRKGETTAEAAVKEALERVLAHADLNAFIGVYADEALERARTIDQSRRQGERQGPLAGLPICIKDNIDVKGWFTTGATPSLAGLMAHRTASVVDRLQQAGAIVIGKTNLHELAFGITNTNFGGTYTSTRNPHDPLRITGGSSGGTAAAVAAGIVSAGLGTDTSGSIRIPASLCGIAGLRPSVGDGGKQRRYPCDGVLPISHTNDTVGPMAVSVADLALLDAAICGGEVAEPVPLSQVTLGLPKCFWDALDPKVETVCHALCNRLKEQGVTFVEVDLPGLRGLLEKISAPVVLHEPIADIPAYLAQNGYGETTLANIAEKIVNPDVQAAFDLILRDALGEAYEAAVSIYRPQLCSLYERVFNDARLDALLFPTTPVPAIEAIDDAFGTIDIPDVGTVKVFDTYIRNTDPGANAGLPGLTIPIGATEQGLPVGIELDGPVGSDRRLLGIGLSLEAILAWRGDVVPAA